MPCIWPFWLVFVMHGREAVKKTKKKQTKKKTRKKKAKAPLARRRTSLPEKSVEPEPIRPLALPLMPEEDQKVLFRTYVDRRVHFRNMILREMVPGIHYGIPPGCEPLKDEHGNFVDKRGNIINADQWKFKPSLYQAGAHFIADLLMLIPKWTPAKEIWEMLGANQAVVVMLCELLNNQEGNPFFPDVPKGGKVGESHGSYQVDDRHNHNAAVKMAQKTSLVGAVIAVEYLSDLFTQDLEYMEKIGGRLSDADRKRSLKLKAWHIINADDNQFMSTKRQKLSNNELCNLYLQTCIEHWNQATRNIKKSTLDSIGEIDAFEKLFDAGRFDVNTGEFLPA